jgi:hypothetical protein
MFVWLSVHFCVIARSVSDEAIKTLAQAYWIASLTLAMTRDNSRYVFIRPRDSGGGGPPVGRWRGRGRATNAAVVRRIVCAVSSLPAMLKDLRSSFLALTLGDSAAPSTTLRVVPLPRFTGAEKETLALCRPHSYPRKRRAEKRNALAAPMRPSFAITTPMQEPKTARAKRRGERSAERRIQNVRRARARRAPACVCGGCAPRSSLLAQRLRAGRARLPAHRCGSRQDCDLPTQLQAMLPGMSARRALPGRWQTQCRDSTSRRGPSAAGRDTRSRPGTVCETARRRRIPLRTQDRIRNAPLDERDSSHFVSDYGTVVNDEGTRRRQRAIAPGRRRVLRRRIARPRKARRRRAQFPRTCRTTHVRLSRPGWQTT